MAVLATMTRAQIALLGAPEPEPVPFTRQLVKRPPATSLLQQAPARPYFRKRYLLPIPPDKPLKERLTMRDDGLLVLDLKDTKLTSLEMLAGAPLGSLALSNVAGISELTPLRGMRLSELDLEGTTVKDLSPLSGMSSLRRLKMARTRVADLSPLAGLPLVHLALESTPVTDLRPLKGMPLEELFISSTHVTSLSALTEAPLKWLEAHRVPLLDFAALTGRPLQRLCLLSARVRDLGFVRGMPLKILALGDCQEVRNLRVLSQIPTLESLLLPSDYWLYPGEELEAIAALKTHPGLKQLGAEYMKGT